MRKVFTFLSAFCLVVVMSAECIVVQASSSYIEVSDATSLMDALDDSSVSHIRLQNDIVLNYTGDKRGSTQSFVSIKRDFVLDGNGFSISFDETDYMPHTDTVVFDFSRNVTIKDLDIVTPIKARQLAGSLYTYTYVPTIFSFGGTNTRVNLTNTEVSMPESSKNRTFGIYVSTKGASELILDTVSLNRVTLQFVGDTVSSDVLVKNSVLSQWGVRTLPLDQSEEILKFRVPQAVNNVSFTFENSSFEISLDRDVVTSTLRYLDEFFMDFIEDKTGVSVEYRFNDAIASFIAGVSDVDLEVEDYESIAMLETALLQNFAEMVQTMPANQSTHRSFRLANLRVNGDALPQHGESVQASIDFGWHNGTDFVMIQEINFEIIGASVVDTTPVDPAPVDPAPVDPTPVDPTPVDPTPVDPTPVDPTPVDPAPQPDEELPTLDQSFKDVFNPDSVTIHFNEETFPVPIREIVFAVPTVSDADMASYRSMIDSQLAGQITDQFIVLSISPLGLNGEKVSRVNGVVSISLQIPDHLDDNLGFAVFHVNGDGSLTQLNYSIEGGIITFEVTEFSDFIIANVDATSEIDAPMLPNTGLAKNIYSYGFVCLGMIVLGYAYRRNKKMH